MTGVQQQVTDVPMRTSHKVPVEWLTLDHENPRLVGIAINLTTEELIAQLYRGEALEELLQSISANGYLDIEPLVVMFNDQDQLVTLEGNRRLAAIRLFREPDLVDRISKIERLRIAMPVIPEAYRETLEEVSVYRVPDRDSARSFIGFKHINGPAKWESFAKGQFAAEWYRSGGVTLAEITNKIGDSHDTIKRMVSAIYVLDQAERTDTFRLVDRSVAKFNFSHLYSALSRRPYMEFLGLEAAWSRYDPSIDPIPTDKLGHLQETLVWIYGSKEADKEPVIQSQNPDIRRLAEVLTSVEGLHVLRAGGSLNEAHSSTESADERLSAALIRARGVLRDAVNSLRGYDGRDQSLLNIAEDVSETAQTIYSRMQKKFKDAMGMAE